MVGTTPLGWHYAFPASRFRRNRRLPEPDQTAAVVFDEINGDEFSTPGKATSIDVVLPANSYSGATKR
jgi:hypothetical protein